MLQNTGEGHTPARRSLARRGFARGVLALCCAALGGCGSPPSALLDAGPPDASVADASPPDAALTVLGPALVLDTIALSGANMVFRLLGEQLLNSQMAAQIESGQFLLVLELRGLDDPSGQSDDQVDLGIYNATDSDDDPSDNFDAEHPEVLLASPGTVGPNGEPSLLFSGASIVGGELVATGILQIPLPGGFPLPMQDAEIRGDLVPAPDDSTVYYLNPGALSGSVPASVLGMIPNILGSSCVGGNMLDVLITSCGVAPVSQQPDVDLDGDGLERFFDTTGGGDAGVPDGVIDLCVDGDGTEFVGEGCWNDPSFADGYLMVYSLHGTRVVLAVEQ